ncbi:MAG: phospholipase D-like domain-containing protein DpdK [Enhygromyxa sp.]
MIAGRDILRHSRYARNEARELLQSIFVAELIQPSREVWLVSPWLNDIVVVDDTAGAFASILQGMGETSLTLSAAVVHIAEAGAVVHVVTRPDQSQDFSSALHRHLARSSAGGRVRSKTVPTLHTKGLAGDDYRLMGSMNFTFNGIEFNDESIRFDRDANAVARVRLEFERQYGGDDA